MTEIDLNEYRDKYNRLCVEYKKLRIKFSDVKKQNEDQKTKLQNALVEDQIKENLIKNLEKEVNELKFKNSLLKNNQSNPVVDATNNQKSCEMKDKISVYNDKGSEIVGKDLEEEKLAHEIQFGSIDFDGYSELLSDNELAIKNECVDEIIDDTAILREEILDKLKDNDTVRETFEHLYSTMNERITSSNQISRINASRNMVLLSEIRSLYNHVISLRKEFILKNDEIMALKDHIKYNQERFPPQLSSEAQYPSLVYSRSSRSHTTYTNQSSNDDVYSDPCCVDTNPRKVNLVNMIHNLNPFSS